MPHTNYWINIVSQKLPKLMKKKKLLDKDIEKITNQLMRYKEGDFIYASALKRNTQISNQEIYDVLQYLMSKMLVRIIYRIRIEDRILDDEYTDFMDLPSEVYDEERGLMYTLNFKSDIFVCYEVIDNE